jgi:hypothetical protein
MRPAEVIPAPESAPLPAVQSEVAAIIQMIERVALNPAADLDKMERLLEMRERVMARAAEAAYYGALAQMQPELPIIDERGGIKDRAGQVQSTYAKWDDINEAIRPVLAKHGFGLTFRIGRPEGLVSVTGVLSHREGHREQTTFELPVDSSGSKNSVQAIGSSVSYGQRYTAKALLNLTSRKSEDDDARAAGGGFITAEQADELRALMDDVGADRGKFLVYMQVDRLEEIPARKFRNALAALEAKRSR